MTAAERRAAERAARQAETIISRYRAQFGGNCARCGGDIGIGDECCQMGNGDNIHAACGDEG